MTSNLAAPPLPLEHSRFAVVDVETTGGRAQRGGRIVEVAVAILEAGTVHLGFTSLLDAGTPIPSRAALSCGAEDPGRHRPSRPARATAYVLRALLGRACERGVQTLEQLIERPDRPRHKLRIADFRLRIGRPPSDSPIRNPQSAIRS